MMALTRAGAAAAGATRAGGAAGEEGGSKIVWDAARRRFHTPDGLAYLDYQEARRGGESNIIDLVHTYVPASKRGGGVASQLCKAACAHARKHNLRIIPTCSYILDTFLPRNPEWRDLVLEDKIGGGSTGNSSQS